MKVVSKQDSSTKEEKNEELVKRHDMKDTPFTICENEEGFFGAVGLYRITEVLKTKKAVEEALKPITWNRLVQVVLILIESNNDQKFNFKKG